MNKNMKYAILLALCVTLLLGLGVIKILIPKYDSISKRADENSATAKAANEKLDVARGLNEKSLTARLKKLQARVPSSLELPNVILKISELANESQLIWLEGTPEDVLASSIAAGADGSATSAVSPSATVLDNHEVSIKVRGEINNLIKFLESITNKSVGRIVVITSTKITPASTNAQDGQAIDPNQVEAEIKMNIIGWVDGGNINDAGCIENLVTPEIECVLTPEGN